MCGAMEVAIALYWFRNPVACVIPSRLDLIGRRRCCVALRPSRRGGPVDFGRNVLIPLHLSKVGWERDVI